MLCCSAVMRLNLRGLMEAHAYPLVSLWSGCSFPVGHSHTAAQRTDIAWTSLSQACSSHFGTDERLIRGPQRERCPPPTPPSCTLHGCLSTWLCCNLDKCMQGKMSTCKEGHICSLHTRFTFSLPLGERGLYGCKLVGAIRVSHPVRQRP